MARPRLYNTPEEKAQAKREAATRWYQKNAHKVNKKKRRQQAKAKRVKRSDAVLALSDNKDSNGNTSAANLAEKIAEKGSPRAARYLPIAETDSDFRTRQENITYYRNRVNRMPSRFRQALGAKPTIFLTQVCETFRQLAGGDLVGNADVQQAKDSIDAHIQRLERLRNLLTAAQSELYTLTDDASWDKSFIKAREISNDIRLVVNHLEDLLWMEADELLTGFAAKKLDFQRDGVLLKRPLY